MAAGTWRRVGSNRSRLRKSDTQGNSGLNSPQLKGSRTSTEGSKAIASKGAGPGCNIEFGQRLTVLELEGR
jgi:hypothetical protein